VPDHNPIKPGLRLGASIALAVRGLDSGIPTRMTLRRAEIGNCCNRDQH
jgi:hypothetical protein